MRWILLLTFILISVAGATFIDAGHTVAWARWARIFLGAACFFATIGAVAQLHRIVSPDHSDLGPSLEADERGPALRKGLFFGAALVLAYLALGKALESYADIPLNRTLLFGFAVGLAWATSRKPWWFWQHWKAHIVRELIGDTATTFIYLAIASVLLYLALFGDPSRVLQ